MSDSRSENTFIRAVPALLFITLVTLLHFISRVISSPLMVTLERELGFSHARAGELFLIIALGGSIGLLANGFIASRLIHRRTIVLASFLASVTLFLASRADTYWQLAVPLFATGCTAGIYFPSGISTITTLSRRRDWGKALALHELAPNLGFIIAPIMVEAALAWGTWRDALAGLGMLQLVMCLIFVFFGPGGRERSNPMSPLAIKSIAGQRIFWALVLLFCLAVSAAVAPYAMLPLYLTTDHGFSREAANGLLSISRVSGLFMAFVAGYAIDRFGVRPMLKLYIIGTTLVTIMLGLSPTSLIPVFVFIQPVLAACYFPAGFTAISRAFEARDRSMAFSLITPIGVVIGQGLAPAVMGFMGDLGNFSLGFVILGTVLLLGFPVLKYLPGEEE